jgi:uncharacterized protein (TIGR02246 family)
MRNARNVNHGEFRLPKAETKGTTMTSSNDESRKQAVLDTLQRWLTAAEQGDVATLDTLLTPDYTYTHATTAHQDARDQWLQIFDPQSAAYRRYCVYHAFDTTVRLYPGTAIVFGHGHQEIVRPNGAEVDLDTTFTCTWVEQDGGWKLVAWQATKKPD